MMMAVSLPRQRDLKMILPAGIVRAMCERALHEWGPDGIEERGSESTRVLLWLGGRSQFAGQRRGRPVGAFTVHWAKPIRSQATIDLLEWDPFNEGSESEVRAVIDALAGWPVGRTVVD